MEQAVSLAPASVPLGTSERTADSGGEQGYAPPTGESTRAPAVTVAPRTLQRRKSTGEQNAPVAPLPEPKVRVALRTHWEKAQTAAQAMVRAADLRDQMELGISADDLDQALDRLWELREHRDLDWRTILNHVQGMMRQLFATKRIESLSAEKCQIIHSIVDEYLGPATKSVDDLNEVLRLIEDAGFDPYAAISDVEHQTSP